MKRTLLALILFPSIAFAAPIKIPTLVVCLKNGTGAMTVKQKCSGGETKLSGGGIGALGIQGPQGPQGVQGPTGVAGGFNIDKCHTRETQVSGSIFVAGTSMCLVNEFVMSSGCYISSGAAEILSHKLVKATNTLLGDQVYGGVTCLAGDVFGSPNSITLVSQAMCCQP